MIQNEIILALMPYANHKSGCESLEVMWHKGPCDCGFAELVVKLRALGIDIIDGSIPTDDPQPELAVGLPQPELADLIRDRKKFLELETQLKNEERRVARRPFADR